MKYNRLGSNDESDAQHYLFTDDTEANLKN